MIKYKYIITIKIFQQIARFRSGMISTPANTAKIRYKVPISLAFVENNHLVILIKISMTYTTPIFITKQ